MSSHHIVITRSARDDERERNHLAHLLAAAFAEIPPTRWLIPDRDARRARFPAYARIWVDHGLAHGTIEVAETPDGALAGLAIWWPEPAPEPPRYQQRLAEAVGHEHLDRFTAFDTLTHQRHPTAEHVYLGFAAVAPAYQNRGYGTELLRRRHTDLDDSKVPAYLVAASADARRLYLRHGYDDLGPPIYLPRGPRIQPMWRHPDT